MEKYIETAKLKPAPGREDHEPTIAMVDNIDKQGVLAPLDVEESGSGFIIHDGVRRWKAAKKVERPVVPCIVRGDARKPSQAPDGALEATKGQPTAKAGAKGGKLRSQARKPSQAPDGAK